jgi:hypothetical protein
LKLKLAVEGGDAGAVADLPFVTVVADKSQADVVWSADGKVEHVVGGVVAEDVDAQSIKGVVSKWAALKWLNHQAAPSPIPAKLIGGNQRYAIGELVEIEIEGAKYPHLTLFNLPPDGRVEFYVPDPGKPDEATKDSRRGSSPSSAIIAISSRGRSWWREPRRSPRRSWASKASRERARPARRNRTSCPARRSS